MAIFGRSKKSKETTPQRRRDRRYPSQVKLQEQYVQDAQANSHAHQQGPYSSHGFYNASPMHSPYQYQPINITQNFLVAPPLPERSDKLFASTSRLNLESATNLLTSNCSGRRQQCNVPVPSGTQLLNQTAALCDVVSSTFDDIIALIDCDRLNEGATSPAIHEPLRIDQNPYPDTSRALVGYGKSNDKSDHHYVSPSLGMTLASKVNLYANSRLPLNLRPMKL